MTDYDLGDGNSTPRGAWCNVSTTITSISYLGPSTSHSVSIMSSRNVGKGAGVWSCQLTTGYCPSETFVRKMQWLFFVSLFSKL